MWSSYHAVRTSQGYGNRWMAFLRDSCTPSATQLCPIFYQYVGHHNFRNLVNELIGYGSEPVADSSDWITIVNREGLVMVNNMAFELFYALEIAFRRLIQPEGNAVQLDEDVLFLWSIISSSWDSDCNSELLE